MYARYMFLLMGLFATFCGLMYNDFVSIPLFVFGDSCYPLDQRFKDGEIDNTVEMIQKEDCVYPAGIDPAWYLTPNELTFMNSLKMKVSVILGVSQMALGVCMKAANSIYYENKLDLFLEFIPQIILLLVLFGYMDMLIIFKWLSDFTNNENKAPSIISTMIGMALDGGNLPPGQSAVIGSDSFQQGLSIFCLLTALVCVPWMLVPKPLIIDKQMREQHAKQLHYEAGIQLQDIGDKERGILDQPKNDDQQENPLMEG